MTNKLKFSIAIHPGETLKEVLKGENMSFIELSHKCKLSKSLIQDIVNGKADITEKVAEELEKVFGVSKEFWNNTQKSYEEAKARLEK